METISVKEFYKEILGNNCQYLDYFLDNQATEDIGHFNVFNIAEMYASCKAKPGIVMPYNRRTYYKISLINGKNRVEYADKTLETEQYAILFATPKIPYRYVPLNHEQSGHFCVFTQDFMTRSKVGLSIDKLPIFSSQSDFVYHINDEQYGEIEYLFNKMHREMGSDYAYKYDLLRTYVMELIHLGQKLSPLEADQASINASTRISALFIELLERQFPIESTSQVLQLKTPGDFADTLKVHVNHLNKVLKDTTGRTTTEIIAGRIFQEARILLRQTAWNISEIAYGLGFEEVAHFSNFFKKHEGRSPLAFRE